MRGYMPAGVFLKCASLSLLIFGAIMWAIILIVLAVGYDDLVKENKWRTYRHGLFLAATGDTTVSVAKQEIAQYLRENIVEFDRIIALEKRITETVGYDSERTKLHVQNPKYVPQVLLTMSKTELWQKLRDDAESLGTLKHLLQKEASVPPLELVEVSADLPWWWPLGIFIPQFFAFFVYLVRWNDYRWSENYHWYDVRLPVRLSMLLLLPGALPIMGVGVIMSVLFKVPAKLSAYWDRRRTDALIAHGGGEQLYTLLSEKLRKGGSDE